MTLLVARYDPWLVTISILVAMLASYVALDLADRVRTEDRSVALRWWIGGSVSLGTGIWSMHFVGMQAFSLPIELGYARGMTLVSWLAGVGASALALRAATIDPLTPKRLALSSIAIGLGICAMHYLGMAALEMTPGIVWNKALIAGSALIALLASAAALLIFSWLRRLDQRRPARYRALAAVVMGFAISGMHYTGMAAAGFPEDSLCLSTNGLSGSHLFTIVIVAAVAMLTLTLLTSILDGRMHGTTMRLAASLQNANASLQTVNEELRQRAFTDPLTGLLRRESFEERLKQAVQRLSEAREGGDATPRLAVLFVDLDGFKPVNDSYGHAAGDDVLRETAIRLRFVARGSDTVARVGGDEFLLLMEDVASVEDCEALARRLVDSLALPYATAEHEVHICASIGIVVYPDHGVPERLIANADAAMYAAKRAGGNTFAQFEPHMDSNTVEQLHLANDLRVAVETCRLELVYQPKIDGATSRICGVEALLRWDHPKRGTISPTVFIPIAERFGLINSIGNWVLEEACRQLREWADDGLKMRVAVNVSMQQLLQPDFVDRVAATLERHRLDGSQLLCEITETIAMGDLKATQRTFDGLGRIGVYLSVDDFGTGYSSLSYLRQLPARQLKIDRSFVNDLGGSADARAVVDAVVRLGHALGLRVVAEGVETEVQRDILLDLGCDELQGFYFARPMSAASLLAWASVDAPVGTPRFTASILGGASLRELAKSRVGA